MEKIKRPWLYSFLEEIGEGEKLEQAPQGARFYTEENEQKPQPRFKFYGWADWYVRWKRGTDRTPKNK